MLPKNLQSAPAVQYEQYAAGKKRLCRYPSVRGAFSVGEEVVFSLFIPRAVGAGGAILRLYSDEAAAREFSLTFSDCQGGVDRYDLRLSLKEIGVGYYTYRFILLCGTDVFFSHSEDGVSVRFSREEGAPFRLTVYRGTLDVPSWLSGGVIYHAFVDRFAPGGGEKKQGAIYHASSDEPILQYPEYPGAPVANNEFYGGTLYGIAQKMPYLRSLGVTVLYLSPIFLSPSSHKYDTSDYAVVDGGFGGEAGLCALLRAAKAAGVRVLLDGVFNHTGADSIYFNKFGNFPTLGAYQSVESPYYPWFSFEHFPDKYDCWWGVTILPKLRLDRADVQDYFLGEGGVLHRYFALGVDGMRLDVADELPDSFLDRLHDTVKREVPGGGALIGEVWENAAEKIAYGKRRHYFQGGQLHSVMNYPMRTAILSFVKGGDSAGFYRVARELWSSYPRPVAHALMNVLSTHDTERTLTVLGGESGEGHSYAELATMKMTKEERTRAKELLKMASAMQYTVYGIPSLYYADEAGSEGYRDPFCRRPYPWGKEDTDLLAHYRALGALRSLPALKRGDFTLLDAPSGCVYYRRGRGKSAIFAFFNRSQNAVPLRAGGVDLLTGEKVPDTIAPDGFVIFRK